MDSLESLDRIFLETLPWHKARVKFFVRFVVALIAVKTVDLGEIAAAFAGKATLDSKYRRLRRFFADFDLRHADVADLVVRLVGIPKPWTLAMDRTNWKPGEIVALLAEKSQCRPRWTSRLPRRPRGRKT